MRIGSLFSGIGHLELGLEAAGMQVVWQCETEPYAREVLKQAWPGVRCYNKIEDLYTKETPPEVDLICGGFPCQPVSSAGDRRGRSDRRWLWPQMLRVIREARPKWVVGENVRGLLTSEDGKAFAEVLRSLAQSRYRVGWFLLRAEDVGSSHRRERVFILGYSEDAYGRRRELQAEAGTRSEASRRGRSTVTGEQLVDAERPGRSGTSGAGGDLPRRQDELTPRGRRQLADAECEGRKGAGLAEPERRQEPADARPELADAECRSEQRRGKLRDVERSPFRDGSEGLQRERGWDAVVNSGGEMANTPCELDQLRQRQGITGEAQAGPESGTQDAGAGGFGELADSMCAGCGVGGRAECASRDSGKDSEQLANTTDGGREAETTAVAEEGRQPDPQRDTGELPGRSSGPHGELADTSRDGLFWCGAPYNNHGCDASRDFTDGRDLAMDRDVHFRDIFPFPPGPGLTVERVEGIRELFRDDPAAARAEFEAELAETLKWYAILEAAPWLNPSIKRDFRGVVNGLSFPLDRHRRKRLRALGNSVVPQAAELIGRHIMQKEAEEVAWSDHVA